jgi:hypothetical protein
MHYKDQNREWKSSSPAHCWGKKCEEAQKAQIVKKKKTTSKEKKRKMKERIKKKQKKDGLPSTLWCRPTGSTPFGSCLGSQSHLLRIKSYYI